MKQAKAVLTVIIALFMANILHAQKPDSSDFLNRITKAYLESDLNSIVGMTYWNGVSPEDKTNAIDKYKLEVALTATSVELLGKDAEKWQEWKQGDTVYTYNSEILHTLVVHLQPGSKMKLKFGEVPVKDLRLPVGLVDGKLYLLRSVPKQVGAEK